ncbi:MAG TPA: peptidase domain-containing ABC transporter [Puia sp.]|uniref:peptidase domain-containing ABC transporter n=1 Tax=Puia sp. TaxID=2045100 RepID=UPI002BDF6707|nr:peptidase domain-containing ABC transporter [Puia sp.]HVU96084.1 peptidase domain-containing ABC transporter [Puia sp.]
MTSTRKLPGSPSSDAVCSGIACLGIVASHYDPAFDRDSLQGEISPGDGESPISVLSRVAEKIGFRTRYIELPLPKLIRDTPLPCILPWREEGYIVLSGVSGRRSDRKMRCIDPLKGAFECPTEEFVLNWTGKSGGRKATAGRILLIEPTFKFGRKNSKGIPKLDWPVVMSFFRHYRMQIVQVIFALLITSLAQLIFPFLMQAIVDVGINTRNVQYIFIILVAQAMLVLSRITVDFIRGFLLLQISTAVNLDILSDFWIKLTRLPIAYFERRQTGDVLQRINDNKRIQDFLTGPTLNIVFSALNFIVFGIVLMTYKVELFFIFLGGVVLYFVWIKLFMKVRRQINYQMFRASSDENETTLQLVQGMQEIRLHNIEQSQRWNWEKKQVGIFGLNFRNLAYQQFQQAGAILINQGKDILLTFVVARLVIEGQLSFGAMLAVQFIVGQLSGPIEQFIQFIQAAQDARISMERLNDIHQLEDEEKAGYRYIRILPKDRGILVNDVSFTYPGSDENEPVLHRIRLQIPEGKITAVVGESGSGKTTLLKLMLKIYEEYEGNLLVGSEDLRDFSPTFWRSQCGAVLQDGYIFNDTIAMNIVLEPERWDRERLLEACRLSNILSFIESLPDGFDTRLGAGGVGISQGQKQRLLIARVVYKDPSYLFFDESTNALDSNNEKAIVDNLQPFFESRTVVVVAHRLSTVRNADNIVVLHHGRIIEQGTHEDLLEKQGKYYSLVQNQLELGVE